MGCFSLSARWQKMPALQNLLPPAFLHQKCTYSEIQEAPPLSAGQLCPWTPHLLWNTCLFFRMISWQFWPAACRGQCCESCLSRLSASTSTAKLTLRPERPGTLLQSYSFCNTITSYSVIGTCVCVQTGGCERKKSYIRIWGRRGWFERKKSFWTS